MNMRMHRLTTAICILNILYLLSNATVSLAQTSLSKKLGLPVKTIYLDPAYGGNECGPRLKDKQCGKKITLLLAKKLQTQLSDAGFVVYLSREEDDFMPLEDRVMRSRSVGADVYLRIKLSTRSVDCIRLFISSKPIENKATQENRTKTASELNSGLNDIFRDLKMNNKFQASSELARNMETNLKAIKFLNCVKTLQLFDYILINAAMPSLTIDFGFSEQSELMYIHNSEKQDAIVRAIMASVTDFAEDHAQSQEQ